MPKIIDVEIDEGVEPQGFSESGRGRPQVYPWSTMSVGDSAFFPATEDNPFPWRTRTSMTAFLNRKYEDRGWRFMTRKHVEDDGEIGARIFRIK